MTVSPDWLHYQAEVHPDRLALVGQGRHWSFAELDADVAQLAGILADQGIQRGKRVAYHLAAQPRQVLLVHALTRLHAVLVPLNIRLTMPELAPILLDADPALVIHDGVLAQWPQGLRVITMDNLNSAAATHPITQAQLSFNDLHTLIYTSGTTGRPKGVELTVANHWWSAQGFALNAGLAATDRWLNVMPLFHVGGLTILFRSVIHGSTVYLEPRFDARAAHALMSSQAITLLSVVPTMLQRLLDLDADAPPSVRQVLLGGAPAPGPLIDEARRRGYPAVPTYGMTETCSQVVTQEIQTGLASRSSGHANLPTQIRIVKDTYPCPPGQVGEIWIQGPTVARGYWRNPEATRKTFIDGWLKTGDVGYLNQNGHLTVTGRLGDIIIRGGENIYPREIEDQLLAYPTIEDVAVFGLDHAEWGQEVACAIVANGSLSLAELRTFLSNSLASYKIPSTYFRMDAIPRNAAGKVLRRRLVDQAKITPRWVDEA